VALEQPTVKTLTHSSEGFLFIGPHRRLAFPSFSATLFPMKLIVGLGNIGSKYESTRHNLGWMAVTAVAEEENVRFEEKTKLRAHIAEIFIEQKKVLLALPTTFMNLSGEAVGSIAAFYQIPTNQILIVQDELDIPLGTMRFSLGGSSAGHNGIRSIEHHLKEEPINRLRLGIGKPTTQQPIEDYVLERFSESEKPLVNQIVSDAEQAIRDWISGGLDKAMQQWNGKKT
jgi:PTH1 family peptidyl-tRNA hydrolase